MNKKLVVSVAFVVIVAIVIISFSTYYATLLETQKVAQDRFLASQQEPQQEFENGSPAPVSYTHLTLPTTPYV